MPTFQKEAIHFPSADGTSQVAGFYYTPAEQPIRAVIQLSHGMCEYICRYEPMFQVLCEAGIAVCGNDHLGHGDTSAPNDYGFMAEQGGYRFILKDLYTMNTLGHKKFPGVPYFLLGHSMGSFYARWYAETWPESIHALILSGTAGPAAANKLGQPIAAAIAALKGNAHVSQLMVKLNFGSYCKRIPDAGSANAWLSRDESVVSAYDGDALCTFQFTAGTYREMLTVLNHVSSKKWAQSINKDLPVLLIAGDADPVGNYGAGVRNVWAMLGDAGVKDLTCQIWEGARHELHNETNREEVFDYVLTWVEDHI